MILTFIDEQSYCELLFYIGQYLKKEQPEVLSLCMQAPLGEIFQQYPGFRSTGATNSQLQILVEEYNLVETFQLS